MENDQYTTYPLKKKILNQLVGVALANRTLGKSKYKDEVQSQGLQCVTIMDFNISIVSQVSLKEQELLKSGMATVLKYHPTLCYSS